MLFDIVTDGGACISQGLDEFATSVRLQEGRVEKGQKRPLDLAPGEETRVTYPLIGRSLACVVRRTE